MYLLIIPFALSLFLLFSRARNLQKAPFQRGDRVLLITAHPDDETMFFSPTIISLIRASIPVSILCLSNGGAYDLGSVREKEMIEACKELKVPEDNVIILDHPDLQDGMKTLWPEELVAQQVHNAVTKYKANQVVTFDKKGVSGHINHIGAHKGVRRYMTDRQYRSAHGTVQCFELISTSLFRKFSGLMDLPVSSLFLGSNCKLVVNPFPGVTTKAMSKHKSQRTWYRHLFTLMSRYTMMNTLRKMERSQYSYMSS